MMSKLSADSKIELKVCAKSAYEETLANYHGFLVKKTFQVGLSTSPARASLIAALGPDEATVLADIKQWCELLKPFLDNLNGFYAANAELDDKSSV